MLAVEVVKGRKPGTGPALGRLTYSVGGMVSIGMARIRDDIRGRVPQISGRTISSIGIQTSSLSSRAGVIRERVKDGVGLEVGLNEGQDVDNREHLENK